MQVEAIARGARLASEPCAHRLTHGDHRLVVRSIGAAGVGLVRSLRRVLPLSEADIAALVLRAPSELVVGLDRERADAIAAFLGEQGLDCAVLGPDAPLTPGVGDHEVALSVDDPARLAGVALEIVRLLGVTLEAARDLLCATPAVLIGGVSSATVEALRARFAPLGAAVDASRPAEARFDLLVAAEAPEARERARARLAAFGPLVDAGGALALLGLDHPSAARAWHAARALDLPARCVNRDLARYAVRLLRATDTPALRSWLVEHVGMPAAIVPRALAHLPIELLRDARPAEAEAALVALSAAGAEAVAEPLAVQAFALALHALPDRSPEAPAAVAALRAIGGLAEADAVAAVHRRRVPGPLSATRARWLRHDLRRAGFDARLEVA